MNAQVISKDLLTNLEEGYGLLSRLMQITIRQSFSFSPTHYNLVLKEMPADAPCFPQHWFECYQLIESLIEDFVWQNSQAYELYRKLQQSISKTDELEDLPSPFLVEMWPWNIPFTVVAAEVHKRLRWRLYPVWDQLGAQYRVDPEKYPPLDPTDHAPPPRDVPRDDRIPLDPEEEIAWLLGELEEVKQPILSYLTDLKGKPPVRKREAPLQDSILSVLSETQPMGPKQIEAALDHPRPNGEDAVTHNPDSVRRACRKLLANGLVTQPAKGSYLRVTVTSQ